MSSSWMRSSWLRSSNSKTDPLGLGFLGCLGCSVLLLMAASCATLSDAPAPRRWQGFSANMVVAIAYIMRI